MLVDYDQVKEDLNRYAEEVAELKAVIQMCFVDACKPSGKFSKKTAIELMKHADLSV